MMLECFVLCVPELNECMVLAIAWQRFFVMSAVTSDALAEKSGQSLGPFLAKTDDDSRTISMFFISLNTDE
jgi:hypothetical protein